MVRSPHAALPDEQLLARGRLEAMGLRAGSTGWVPEQLDPLDPVVSVDAVEPPDPPAAVRQSAPGGLARAWLADRVPLWARDWVERVRVGTVVSWLAIVAALTVVAVVLLHHHTAATSYSASDSSWNDAPASDPSNAAVAASTSVAASPAAAGSIVVDVGGRVRKPGLVTLPAGARVADAIAAAGGPLRHKEVATIDLAARVSDGQLLLVGVSDPSAASGTDGAVAGTGGAASPVGLNAATLEQLETLPGVGPVTAQKIIDWRTSNNGFTDVSQLQQVPGIGPAKFAEISPLVSP